jgi:ubiquinone/menaquinone biosynthesis C-methylase UbiE
MASRSVPFYSKPILALYDVAVLGFSNSVVWKCPTRLILAHYNAHVSGRHLDVGVGTGYFLDHCTFPVQDPVLTLMDLNPNSLAFAARRLRRYHPETLVADVLTSVQPQRAPFDSIGINYLLHCLPGPMCRKGVAIGHLAPLLKPGGVLFGTTILGQGGAHGSLARLLLAAYNRAGVFGNRHDSVEALVDMLSAHFRPPQMHVVGSVAFFLGRT